MRKFFKTTSLTALLLALNLFFGGATIYGEPSEYTLATTTSSATTVIPCGTPLGIKLYSGGAIVVETNDIVVNFKSCSPAKDAGIQKGDIITCVNGKKINSNEDLIGIVESSNGEPICVEYSRDEKNLKTMVTPVATDGKKDYKIGVWLKDSVAGIGTLTFYNPENKTYAALGHAVCESDTGKLVPLREGTPVNAVIDSVTKGVKGCAGCLSGHLTNDMDGNITANTNQGIYGNLNSCPSNEKAIEVAKKSEIKEGKAEILTTINGSSPKRYDAEIETVLSGMSPVKNFVVKITDEKLLSETGGIVQGMSGSPIIQNGKLVGAVTHVFINDPSKGYGIYAQSMIVAFKKAT